MFSASQPLTKKFLLERIREEDIFERYLGIRPEFQGTYCNPLRTDTHPGCGFYINPDDRIKFKDHSQGYNWDCFAVVEFSFRVDFKEAMKIIARDFGVIEGRVSDPIAARTTRQKEKTEIRIKRRIFNKQDQLYWTKKYGLTETDCTALDIFPVSHVWYQSSKGLDLVYYYEEGKKPEDVAYAYHWGGYDYKIYFPNREKGRKFRQNRGDIVQGINKLPPKGHILLITKSYKDVGVANKVGKPLQLFSIAPMSESQVIPPEILGPILPNWDYVFTLFDFDRAGIKLMRQYEEQYNIKGLLFGSEYRKGIFTIGQGGIKDLSDFRELYGADLTFKLFSTVYEELIG